MTVALLRGFYGILGYRDYRLQNHGACLNGAKSKHQSLEKAA